MNVAMNDNSSRHRRRRRRRRRQVTTHRYFPLAALLVLSSPRLSLTAASNSYHSHNVGQEQDELPLTNRLPFKLQRRYPSKNNVPGGYIFLKHLRKTGGTTLRTYLEDVMVYYRKLELERQQQNHDGKQGRKSVIGNLTYYEQEFYAMDWQCPTADADRWRDTLSIVALRHPIERHLSEFFYSGPASEGRLKELHKSGDYGDEFAHLVRIELPKWIEEGIIINREKGCLRRHFSDNFQVRALGGHVDMTQGDVGPLPYTQSPRQSCSVHRWSNTSATLVNNRHCGGCADFCDGPCSYGIHWRGGVSAGGVVTKQTQHRAMDALAKFDVVLLTETMGEDDQVQLMADVTGVPITNASLAADSTNMRSSGHGARTVEQKYHYYQDIVNEAAPDLWKLIEERSRYEMDLYAEAVRINSQLTLHWREERSQQDKEHADDE